MSKEPLSEQLTDLVAQARDACSSAYAPYSKFHVGAALLCEDGRVFRGVNVENSSYGLTICAERTAAVTAVAAGATRFNAIAIASPGGASPCGACRQFLYEFGEMTVLLTDTDIDAAPRVVTLAELLPDGFRLA